MVVSKLCGYSRTQVLVAVAVSLVAEIWVHSNKQAPARLSSAKVIAHHSQSVTY